MAMCRLEWAVVWQYDVARWLWCGCSIVVVRYSVVHGLLVWWWGRVALWWGVRWDFSDLRLYPLHRVEYKVPHP